MIASHHLLLLLLMILPVVRYFGEPLRKGSMGGMVNIRGSFETCLY